VQVAAEVGLPLSYFGTGPEVPDDVAPVTIVELARRVLDGGTGDARSASRADGNPEP
jgi:flagellar biosynthesis GTPase FlhF